MGKLSLSKAKTFLAICLVVCLFLPNAPVAQAATASTLKVSGYATLSTLLPGQAFVVKGTVTSNYKITEVKAYIQTSDGTEKYSKTVQPDAKKYALSDVNEDMHFELLTVGSYVFQIDATDSSGKSKNVLTQNFIVQSDLSAFGYSPLSRVKEKQKFAVKGMVTSSYKIKQVTASIATSSGTVKYTKTVKPNATSYDLSGVDAAMRFDLLAAGSYVFKVDAKDSSGTLNTVINQTFTVVVDAVTPNVLKWVADCKTAHQYYAKKKFSYGVASPSYIGTKTKNKKTNCAAYVSWCLYRNGFVKKVSDTNQCAQGVAAYVRTLGWKMNTDVNNIKTGDIVYYNQKKVTKANKKAAIQWVKTHKANQGGSGMHVDICYDGGNKKFLTAGSNSYITTGKIAFYGSYLKEHFVCSFRYPK